jgi:hypothetical protein
VERELLNRWEILEDASHALNSACHVASAAESRLERMHRKRSRRSLTSEGV